jgi:hypothetical protein
MNWELLWRVNKQSLETGKKEITEWEFEILKNLNYVFVFAVQFSIYIHCYYKSYKKQNDPTMKLTIFT